jgi:hypothetical protein
MKTERNAADFGLHPEFFGHPGRLVALAEYMRYLQLQAIEWHHQTGERVRSRGLYAMVSDELNIDADVLADWAACGEAIIWDREMQAMSPEEREAYIAGIESDPTPEEIAEFNEWDSQHPSTHAVSEWIVDARTANYEIDVLNHLFDIS